MSESTILVYLACHSDDVKLGADKAQDCCLDFHEADVNSVLCARICLDSRRPLTENYT